MNTASGVTKSFIAGLDIDIMPKKAATHAPIDKVQPDPNQPRKVFDEAELRELADSIKANGVLSPIGVLAAVDGMHTIVFGERRWRASKMAGLSDIPIGIVDPVKVNVRAVQLVENIQRARLSPNEIAIAIDDLAKGGMKYAEIATQLGMSKARVSEYKAVVEMPEAIRVHVDQIGSATAYQLFGLWKKDKEAVEAFLSSTAPEAINRPAITRLGDAMSGKGEGQLPEAGVAPQTNESGSTAPVPSSPPKGGSRSAPSATSSTTKDQRESSSEGKGGGVVPVSPIGQSEVSHPQFIVQLGEEFGRLLIDRTGPDPKTALVAFDQGRDIRPVPLSDLVIFEIVAP
ncbi:ParB/RepB/Spo0J family partition protein [Aureimonas sp. N4]|uniref:ParB/RepB/Spo0J family partition protein n=1 Tax=Aureimonas sp. N4 TaxID=1638165 RepID=UPI0007847F4F|nr:ParB/RepB/Spo0J family partition protein [Aureimonas sp. N4]